MAQSPTARKHLIQNLIGGSLILTVFFALLLIYYSVPVEDEMDIQVNDQILIKQHEQDRWATMPGSLGYAATRKLDFSLPTPPSEGKDETADPPAKKTYSVGLKTKRIFEGVNYRPTESVVGLSERYDYEVTEGAEDMKTSVTVRNSGALSVWYQLNHRPDFLGGFKALSQLKKLLAASNPYERYLAKNMYEFGYKDQAMLATTVLAGLDSKAVKTIYEDAEYGLNSPDLLYRWVLAEQGGAESQVYKDIVAHFQDPDSIGPTIFTDKMMAQIAGPASLMRQLDTAFKYRVAFILYHTSKLDTAQLAADQWSMRSMTEDDAVPLVPLAQVHVDTIHDLFKSPIDQEIPWSLTVPDYPPELNYHLQVTNKVSFDDAKVTQGQALVLLSDAPGNAQSLLNPEGMYFFYDKVKRGELDAIRKRFSFTPEVGTHNLTDPFINGLYGFLQKASQHQLQDQQPAMGSEDGDPTFSTSSFASLLSNTLRKSYKHLYTQMEQFLPTRWLAAWLELNPDAVTDPDFKAHPCLYFVTPTSNATRAAAVCRDIDFSDLSDVKLFALAQKVPALQNALQKKTNLTDDEITALYDPSHPLQTAITELDALASTTYGCAAADACDPKELTMMQWSSGAVTTKIPPKYKESKYFSKSANCINAAWYWGSTAVFKAKNDTFAIDALNMYQCPEFVNYGKIDAKTADALFDADGHISLDDEYRALKITQYVINNPVSDESKKKLAAIYSVPDGEDFYEVFDQLRTMVQNYMLGNATKTQNLEDLVYGYYDDRISQMYNETGLQDGKEFALKPFITPIYNDPSTQVKSDLEEKQHMGIYTGSLNLTRVSQIRFINDKAYINQITPIFDGLQDQQIQILPGNKYVKYSNMTNGMQFAPDTKDKINAYDPRFLTNFKYDEAADTKDKDPLTFGDTNKSAGIPVRHFVSTVTPDAAAAGLAFGQDMHLQMTDNTLKVEPSTGLMISRSLATKAKIQFQGSTQQMDGKATKGIILPLPSLDSLAGKEEDLYTSTESIVVDQDKYNDQFSYVQADKDYQHATSIAWLVLMLLFGATTCILLAYYCMKVKKETERRLEGEAVDEVQAALRQLHLE